MLNLSKNEKEPLKQYLSPVRVPAFWNQRRAFWKTCLLEDVPFGRRAFWHVSKGYLYVNIIQGFYNTLIHHHK